MKKFALLLIAAVAGSLFTVGALYWLTGFGEKETAEIYRMEHRSDDGVVYTKNEAGTIVPLDFTKASADVMDAVVHITASQSVTQDPAPQGQEIPEPFRDFFGEEFYKRFFGPGQQQSPRNQPRQRQGSGSGVILNGQGHIVTNNHVVANADEILVTLHDNRTYKAEVVGTDPSTDLALLKIEERGLPFLAMINSDSLHVGDWVLAVGNPFNLTSTVTAGIVSAKARNINIMRDRYAIESFIQTDAAINPGNSGGALVNLDGGLVGINTAIASPTGSYSGYGFAIPSNIVRKIVEDFIEYGIVQRGYLGVTIRNVTGDLALEKGLDVTEGVYIDSILENSAADQAGIKRGDIITAIDGKDINKSAQLLEAIARHRPGDEINIVLKREADILRVDAELHSAEGTARTMSKKKGKVLARLGAQFDDISDQTAEKLDIDGGVRITQLHAGLLKQQTDIREGFIITKVNQKTVSSVKDLIGVLEKQQGGILLEGVYENVEGTRYYALGL